METRETFWQIPSFLLSAHNGEKTAIGYQLEVLSE
jgi:hypothetical protein